MPTHDSLIVELTQACNHDCLHCYNVWKNSAPYPSRQLSPEQTIRLLDQVIGQTHCSHITLTGGEPLLRPDLSDIVGFLRKRQITTNLITNGTLLDEAMIAGLADQISVFELPLLSVDRDIHDRMSGMAGAFDRVTLAIAGLKAARQRVVCVFVATRLNIPTFQQTVELALALGVDGLMFNRCNPGGRGFDNLELLQASPAELADALDQANDLSTRYAMPISCSIAMPPCLFDLKRWPQLSFGFCAVGTARAYYTIDPSGNLRPCNHSPRILGNLLTDNFWDLLNSPQMAQFIAAHPTFCSGCSQESICQGGCKAAAEACYGCVSAMDPFLQQYAKSILP